MTVPNTERRKVQSIERGCQMLDYLRQHGPSTISELESTIDLSAGSIHTYLSTLKDHGFVEQQGSEYQLGSIFVPFGVRVRNESELYQSSRVVVEELALETGGCVHLMTEYNSRLLILEEIYGEDIIGKDFHVEKRGRLQHHIHCTAGGKAILAYLPEDEVHQILDDHGFPPRTSNTITDRDQLLDELEEVREQGYALNDQEHMTGIRAVGAPILRDDDQAVLGTISVSGSATRWTEDLFTETLPKQVKEAANDIEINIHSKHRSI